MWIYRSFRGSFLTHFCLSPLPMLLAEVLLCFQMHSFSWWLPVRWVSAGISSTPLASLLIPKDVKFCFAFSTFRVKLKQQPGCSSPEVLPLSISSLKFMTFLIDTETQVCSGFFWGCLSLCHSNTVHKAHTRDWFFPVRSSFRAVWFQCSSCKNPSHWGRDCTSQPAFWIGRLLPWFRLSLGLNVIFFYSLCIFTF